jgi:hypothetical protein
LIFTPRERARWYKLIPHEEQIRLVKEERRFKVVPAGRRSGKTERAKRYMVKQALKNSNEAYFIAAPTRDQVKKIYWEDIKLLSPSSFVDGTPGETELIVRFLNGSYIQLIGLDKPARIEGAFWSGGVIDEIADIKPHAWEEHIRPALDTFNPARPDYLAWCWLIGVPDGLNHYYDMAMTAQADTSGEWGYYHWKSSEILPKRVIEAAKRDMSLKQFRQEYEASFETASGRVYEDYSTDNHVNKAYDDNRPIIWCHDFNYTPLSSCIIQEYGEESYIVDEIILESAVAENAAIEFAHRYKDAKVKKVYLYGDAAGRAGEKHGQDSSWTMIKGVLREHGWKIVDRVPRGNGPIIDGQNTLRARICNASGERRFFVNPKCKYSDRGLATTQLKEGSAFQEADSIYQHITTAMRYYTAVRYPIKRNDMLSVPHKMY